MANVKTQSVALRGMASAVPDSVATLEDLMPTFDEEELNRLAKNTGVYRRHLAPEGMCSSDLCYAAADRLLQELGWDRDSVDLLVHVSGSPDYFSPATSSILQHRLGLSKGCAAFDIPFGCSGYVYGLCLTSQLLSSGSMKRALLLVGETVTRRTSPQDRSLAPLVGDAGTATALEWDEHAEPMFFDLGTDGGGAQDMIIKAGGMRYPSTEATRIRTEQQDGNIRSDEDIHMNGPEIFAFGLREVPPMCERVLNGAGWGIEDIDSLVMHQANLFLMKSLVRKMKVPTDKMVLNMADFGNTGGSSIPLAITSQLAPELRNESKRLVLLAFGVGLSWAGGSLTCGPLVIPELTLVAAPSPTHAESMSCSPA